MSEATDKVGEVVEEIVLIEFLDLEECSKSRQEPQKAKRYRIRIDNERFDVEVHEMTGRQILTLVKKTPETYQLSEKRRGKVPEVIKADQVVVFHHHAIERFHTLATDQTEG